MTAIATVRVPATAASRRYLAAGTFIALGVLEIALFGLTAHAGDAVFALSVSGSGIRVPSIQVAAAPACFVLGALSIGTGALRVVTDPSARVKQTTIGVALVTFVLALLCWADASSSVGPLNVILLLQGTMLAAIPLVLGALSGCLCERSGVINIAIEGQLICGAFAGAAFASLFNGLWWGVIAGCLAGGLVGALLGVFAIKYRANQIIVGVVITTLALGLTDYLYNRVMAVYSTTLNAGNFFGTTRIPLLGSIPIIGPIFFDSSVFLYLTYALIILIQVGLFHTRWGLRVRAVGEHPTAADTVGIKVLWIRYRNVILGGMVAGLGGAYLTVGSVGTFTPGMSNGFGYIGLAAMIFGRWTPLGSVAAALLFGFSKQLGSVLGLLNVPVPTEVLAMTPYVATILAVVGLVGRVRPPAADGLPYVKS
ncbi:MAG TPA: ABC transporter permease [Streptosporangiaceae bacterium]